MAEGQEQNRSEAPTPFKLKKAREKGQVARSTELGFLGGLIALAGFLLVSGPTVMRGLTQAMRIALSSGFARASEPGQVQEVISKIYWSALSPIALLGGTVMVVVVLLEIAQLRGFLFTLYPLKPDFSRLNPAKGLKRLFSMRLVKETLKSILKMAAYALATYMVIRFAISHYGTIAGDGQRLAEAMRAATMRLLFVFLAVAVAFVLLDQLLVRGEFLKQMRMSRRELTRESREREGEPRIKRRRRQLHTELIAQGRGTGALAGSDMVIVNPEHFAVALRYDEATMAAPAITAKGRNAFALLLRNEAFRLGVPVIRNPELARALFRRCAIGTTITADHFEMVATLYVDHRRADPAPENS